MKYIIEDIAAILKADTVIHLEYTPVEYLLTDSRRIAFPAASLFFALQSARRDGHNFIEEVYQRGVRNFVVKKNFNASKFPKANFLFVDDALESLQDLAAYHRSRFTYPVIGITGSNGKTIVKEWLHQLLSPEYNIVRSPRSYNSQIGVPLSAWQMNEENNLAIFEAGISKYGEMEKLEKIIHPTIGIITNIGEAHGENFENALEKAKEKMKLFDSCEIMFCNRDDEIIQQAIPADHSYDIITWGVNENAEIKIISIEKKTGKTIIIAAYSGELITFDIPFTDDASVQNAVICAGVLLYFNITVPVIQQRMHHLLPVDMRLQLVQAINGCSVINDSYSFDISSFAVALDFLLQQQQNPQKTIIISDLPATHHSQQYVAVMDMLEAKHIQRVITIGEQWNAFIPLLKNKIPVTQHYRSTEHFIQQFTANHFRNEAILLKGARVFGFEKIAALLEKKVHQTEMEINLTALVHNLKQYQQQLNPGVKLMAMVKAFGYGSGSAEVANMLQFHKVDYLAVAYADEGVELRKAGISLPILVMNIDEAAFEALVQYNLEPELFSLNIFTAFDQFLQKQGLQQYPVHIKLDTGMHRLGFEEENITVLVPLLKNNKSVVIKSVFSHLAAGEDPDEDAFTNQQVEKFEHSCSILKEAIGYNFMRHIANTAAIIRNPAIQFDMVRLGIGLYGVDSANTHQLSLQTVAALKTTVAQLRKVKAVDTIGYNRKGKVNRDSIIATIRIGYADGFNRRMGNGNGKVFINGKIVPVVGNVCMDMTMIDVTDIAQIAEGDEVEIFGAHIPVQQVAQQCETIPYEILTGISQRVKRVYVEE